MNCVLWQMWDVKKGKGAFLACYSKWVQTNFISNNNVHLLCLFCNYKKSENTEKSSTKSITKCGSNCFQWCHLSHSHLYCYRFFTVALHESGTRYFGQSVIKILHVSDYENSAFQPIHPHTTYKGVFFLFWKSFILQ